MIKNGFIRDIWGDWYALNNITRIYTEPVGVENKIKYQIAATICFGNTQIQKVILKDDFESVDEGQLALDDFIFNENWH